MELIRRKESGGTTAARCGRFFGTAAVAAALSISAAACGGSSGSGGQSLTIAIPPAVSGIDVYTAQAQGFFAQHHLKVRIKSLNGGAAIVPAMESGAVRIGETNVLSVIQGAAHGIKEPCFSGANTDPTSGHYLSLVAGPKSGATRASGLAGKTIAVNATSGVNELLVDAYLAAQGVSPSSVHFVGLQYPDMAPALQSGRVAAAMTTEPFTSLALGQKSTVLSATPLAAVPGTPTYSCWNAESSWLSGHKSVAAEFAAAMRQTDAYITAHPSQFRSTLAAHLKIDSSIQNAITLPLFTDKLGQSDVTAWENSALKYKMITKKPPLGDVFMGVGS